MAENLCFFGPACMHVEVSPLRQALHVLAWHELVTPFSRGKKANENGRNTSYCKIRILTLTCVPGIGHELYRRPGPPLHPFKCRTHAPHFSL